METAFNFNNDNLVSPYGGTTSSNQDRGGMTTMMSSSELVEGHPNDKDSSNFSVHNLQDNIHPSHSSINQMGGGHSLSQAMSPPISVVSNNNLIISPPEDFNDDSEDDECGRGGDKRTGRRKIRIEYIEDKSRRHITFSKRKAGIMKKAYELSTLTGTQVLLLVASETGHVYTFATPKLQPLITKPEGKNLIQACLNAVDPPTNEYNNNGSPQQYENVEESHNHVKDDEEKGHLIHSGVQGYGLVGGFPYPQGHTAQGVHPGPPQNIYVNPAHYPSYAAAQYNAALAAGYWPNPHGIPSMSTGMPMQTAPIQPSQQAMSPSFQQQLQEVHGLQQGKYATQGHGHDDL